MRLFIFTHPIYLLEKVHLWQGRCIAYIPQCFASWARIFHLPAPLRRIAVWYIFSIFILRFWLAQIPWLIPHNQLALTQIWKSFAISVKMTSTLQAERNGIGTSKGFEPMTSRYRCQLSYEAKLMLEAGQLLLESASIPEWFLLDWMDLWIRVDDWNRVCGFSRLGFEWTGPKCLNAYASHC